MARIITTENPKGDVRRFLRHWTNPAFVEDRLREQHAGLGSDRRRTKARQISSHVHQGLAFLVNADQSPLLTKPLTLFYAAENLAKAACICRDQKLVTDQLRAHGLGGDRNVKRYSIKNLACHVHSPGKDVWSHVFRSFNCDRYRVDVREAGSGVTYDVTSTYATKPLKPPAQLQLGGLLRHLPELADDVEFASWGTSYLVRADSLVFTNEPGPPATQSARFLLRHRRRPKVKEMILDRESDLLRKFDRVRDEYDVFEYSQGDTEGAVMHPPIRLDVFGDPYMNFARGSRVLGETPIYLAALFILSDVVRYQAEHWLRLLEDHPAEEILIDRFLDIAVRKLPNLILSELHQEIFQFKLAR